MLGPRWKKLISDKYWTKFPSCSICPICIYTYMYISGTAIYMYICMYTYMCTTYIHGTELPHVMSMPSCIGVWWYVLPHMTWASICTYSTYTWYGIYVHIHSTIYMHIYVHIHIYMHIVYTYNCMYIYWIYICLYIYALHIYIHIYYTYACHMEECMSMPHSCMTCSPCIWWTAVSK